jgi:hypothetical protein
MKGEDIASGESKGCGKNLDSHCQTEMLKNDRTPHIICISLAGDGCLLYLESVPPKSWTVLIGEYLQLSIGCTRHRWRDGGTSKLHTTTVSRLSALSPCYLILF